jgi:diacylglycerol kinase family enzyme
MAGAGPRAELRQVKGEDLDDAARAAVAQDFDAIVAAGGDGTIMTVAGTLMDQGAASGCCPSAPSTTSPAAWGIPRTRAARPR